MRVLFRSPRSRPSSWHCSTVCNQALRLPLSVRRQQTECLASALLRLVGMTAFAETFLPDHYNALFHESASGGHLLLAAGRHRIGHPRATLLLDSRTAVAS